MIHVLPHRLHGFLLAFSYSEFDGSDMFQTGATKDWESFEMLNKPLLGTSPYASIRLLNINGHGMSEHSSVLLEDARAFLFCYAYTCSQRRWSLAPSLHSPPYVMQMQVPINSSLWLSVGHLLCLQDFVVCDVICCTPLDHISYVSYVSFSHVVQQKDSKPLSTFLSGWTHYVQGLWTITQLLTLSLGQRSIFYFFCICLSWSLPISWTFLEKKNLKEKNLLVDTIEIHQLYRGILFCQEGWQGGVGQGQLTFCHLLNAEVPLGG